MTIKGLNDQNNKILDRYRLNLVPVLPSYRNQSTDLLIASQLTGFFMRETLTRNGLNNPSKDNLFFLIDNGDHTEGNLDEDLSLISDQEAPLSRFQVSFRNLKTAMT